MSHAHVEQLWYLPFHTYLNFRDGSIGLNVYGPDGSNMLDFVCLLTFQFQVFGLMIAPSYFIM